MIYFMDWQETFDTVIKLLEGLRFASYTQYSRSRLQPAGRKDKILTLLGLRGFIFHPSFVVTFYGIVKQKNILNRCLHLRGIRLFFKILLPWAGRSQLEWTFSFIYNQSWLATSYFTCSVFIGSVIIVPRRCNE